MKRILLIVIFFIGFYYIFSNLNSNKKVLNNIQTSSTIILTNFKNNVSKRITKQIDSENEFNSSNNIENLETKNSNISRFKKSVLIEENNFSEEIDNSNQDELYKNTEVIKNSDFYYLNEEDFEIETNLNLSNFFYDFSEKENLDIDDFEDVLKY